MKIFGGTETRGATTNDRSQGDARSALAENPNPVSFKVQEPAQNSSVADNPDRGDVGYNGKKRTLQEWRGSDPPPHDSNREKESLRDGGDRHAPLGKNNEANAGLPGRTETRGESRTSSALAKNLPPRWWK